MPGFGGGMLPECSLAGEAPEFIRVPPGVPSLVSLEFSSTNPNARADEFFALADWGDESVSFLVASINTNGALMVGGTHSYASAGSYALRVRIFGVNGESLELATTVIVADAPPPTFKEPVAPEPVEEPPPVPAPVSNDAEFSPPLLVDILTSTDTPPIAPPAFPATSDGQPVGVTTPVFTRAPARALEIGGVVGKEVNQRELVDAVPEAREAPEPFVLPALPTMPSRVPAEDAAFVNLSIEKFGVPEEYEPFLLASAGGVVADCYLGEMLPLLPLEEIPEEPPPSSNLLDDPLMFITLLWFVANMTATAYELR
jgi:hypothetical protein